MFAQLLVVLILGIGIGVFTGLCPGIHVNLVAATLLAGEIGICAGITSDEFLEPHIRASIHTKEKAYLEQT